ncbi:5'-nucleotidase domain-containing protein 1 [Fukomys damarensis]|uniref:5'-nucleotidase domain-containing protein 1 n=1 Tax=Fukomys damarensis TaxID=885580 RepID=UPI00053FF30B|nr:5'-nucleotidase domain-containing protein 1 [Fukomys damarensis]
MQRCEESTRKKRTGRAERDGLEALAREQWLPQFTCEPSSRPTVFCLRTLHASGLQALRHGAGERAGLSGVLRYRQQQLLAGGRSGSQRVLKSHGSSVSENCGLYFPEIKRDPGKYLHRCPKSVRKWLQQLKSAGKILLLITSSHSDYCRLLCEYTLGDDFADLFDIVITNALKPGFFSHSPSQRPFYTLKDDEEQEALPSLDKPGWYSRGNAAHLYELLKKMTGKPQPKVVYFGDSMHSDIFPASHYSHWETVLILEELRGEEGEKPEEAEPLEKRGKYEGPKAKPLNTLSKKWGSFFIDSVSEQKNTEDSLVYTWSSNKISAYSTIAIPSIEAIAELPLDYKFTRFSSNSSKTAGYYPLVHYTDGLIK